MFNKITFFGTGTSQGIPVISSNDIVSLSNNPKDNRLRSSLFIEYNDKNILIDCGPDFRQQMLKHKKNNVDAVLITHEHYDHIGGLDDLRPIIFHKNIDMPLYSSKRILTDIKTRYAYAFADNKYPGVPHYSLREVNRDFYVEEILVKPINVLHGNLPIYSYKIDNIAYLTDVSYIPDSSLNLLYNLDILIINALQINKHHSHFNLAQALDIIEKLKPKKAYITHISHKLGLHNDIQKTLKENVFLAYDGLEIDF